MMIILIVIIQHVTYIERKNNIVKIINKKDKDKTNKRGRRLS